jgi:pyruvate dehydrogenase E2 component (dihydrolipoamide acetyltransferase)
MSKEFKLPELGENILSADVLHVLIKKGDVIDADQPVLEIETDKATIEVPSTVGGRVKEVFVKDGEKVQVGQVIFSIDEVSGEAAAEEAPAPAAAAVNAAPAAVKPAVVEQASVEVPAGEAQVQEMQLPELGENITSADVLKVLVKVGDTIKQDDIVLEIETDKATIEVPSTVSGVITDVFVKEGDKATVGQVVIKVTGLSAATVVKPAAPAPVAEVKEAPAKVEAAPAAPSPQAPAPKKFSPFDNQPAILTNPAPAAPSVRRLARELGVNINNVPGTGANKRITLDDVKAYVKSLNLESRKSSGGAGIAHEPLPDFGKYGETERAAMSKIRSITADHLSYAWATIPHVTQFDKADITEIEAMRKSLSGKVEEKGGGKLTVTAILIKVVASALKVFPQFNASVDMEKKEVVYKKYYNIGVAVDTERGLIVPVINNVDKKNITEIAAELAVISDKARKRKITPDDLQGGCFTISNLGGIGGTSFTPIINAPEVAILGVSRGAMEQVYKNGAFSPRLMLPLSLSYDHRVIDGADGIRFLRWIIDSLEQPMRLLIEV